MTTARPMLSVGSVRHERLRPASNAFSYGVFTLMLPLRTLGDAALGSSLCARNRFNLLSFYDRDHGDGSTPLLLQGAEASPTAPEAVTKMMRDEHARWSKVIQAQNLKF